MQLQLFNCKKALHLYGKEFYLLNEWCKPKSTAKNEQIGYRTVSFVSKFVKLISAEANWYQPINMTWTCKCINQKYHESCQQALWVLFLHNVLIIYIDGTELKYLLTSIKQKYL